MGQRAPTLSSAIEATGHADFTGADGSPISLTPLLSILPVDKRDIVD
jgi:hypothetical protein